MRVSPTLVRPDMGSRVFMHGIQPVSRKPLPAAIISGGPKHSSSAKRRLLWVDDSPVLLSLYKTVFEGMGFDVLSFSSPEASLRALPRGAADVAILDYDMPEMNGAKLASLLKSRFPALPVILYTGSDAVPRSAQRYVDAVCAKSEARAELLAMINRLASRSISGKSRRPAGPRHSVAALRRNRLNACKASSRA